MGFLDRHKVKFGVGSVLGIPLAATGGALYLLSTQPEPTPSPQPPPTEVVVIEKKSDRIVPSEPEPPVIIIEIPDVDDIEFPGDAILRDSSDPVPAPQIEQQVVTPEQRLQNEIDSLRADVSAIKIDRAELIKEIERLKVTLKANRAKVSQSVVQEGSLNSQIEKLKQQIERLERSTVRHNAGDVR